MTATTTLTAPPMPGGRATDKPRRPARRHALLSTGYQAVSAILATIFLLPILWALLNSFKTTQEANQSPPTWFPQSWSLSNYEKFATYGSGVWTYVGNSVLMSALVIAGTVVVTVLAGYGFARYRFRGKNLLFGSTILILMVPHATLLIPLFLVVSWLGLANTIIGLALVQVMFLLPFATFMMKNAFEAIPPELEDAARVDGCGTFAAFRHISLPLVIPAIVTVGLYAFIASWNEFLLPLVFLNGDRQFTLPIMLASLSTGQYGEIDWGALQAGIMISIIPVLVIYLLLQRYYVAGMVNGALRG